MDALTYSIRDRQKIKRFTRKMIQDIPGHRRLDPNEKKYRQFHKFKRDDNDK